MHFPFADARYYWSGSLRITHDGYKPVSIKAVEDYPLPSELPSVAIGDVFLRPKR